MLPLHFVSANGASVNHLLTLQLLATIGPLPCPQAKAAGGEGAGRYFSNLGCRGTVASKALSGPDKIRRPPSVADPSTA